MIICKDAELMFLKRVALLCTQTAIANFTVIEESGRRKAVERSAVELWWNRYFSKTLRSPAELRVSCLYSPECC